jgi:hypothetical protein
MKTQMTEEILNKWEGKNINENGMLLTISELIKKSNGKQ